MLKDDLIAVTGAAGFIGSNLVTHLNSLGFEHLVLVDDFSDISKVTNLKNKKYHQKVHRDQFFDWLQSHPESVKYIFHLGARTDTTLKDYKIFKELNLDYSKYIWEYCTEQQIPLVYASSAATYGGGELGYTDNASIVSQLKPLNPYAVSKNEFDRWVIDQKKQPPFWAGVKFFNVFGPGEYHKGRMASVIFHAYHQIKERGKITLFRSHKDGVSDGEQMRDFIYVNDVVKMCVWLMERQPEPGLYNIGTGKARHFNDLAKAIFDTLKLKAQIVYIDTPEDIRDSYQYFTEADISKLRSAGYVNDIYTLEEGVGDYVRHYLEKN